MESSEWFEFVGVQISKSFFGVACVFVISKDCRILFVQRADGDHSAFGEDKDIEPPSGGIDIGESPRVSAARELREEAGIVVDPSQLIYFDTGWKPGAWFRGGVARYVLYVNQSHEDIDVELDPKEHKDHFWLEARPEILASEARLPGVYQKCVMKAWKKLVKRGLMH